MKENIRKFCTPAKLLSVLAFLIFGAVKSGDVRYALVGAAEAGIIFALTDRIGSRFTRAGRIFNDILILIVLIQTAFLSLGGSYVTLQMMTNVESIGSLGGKTFKYALVVVLAVLVSLIPVYYLEEYDFPFALFDGTRFLAPLLAAELILTLVLGSTLSPVYGLLHTAYEGIVHGSGGVGKKTSEDASEAAAHFYRGGTDQSYPKPENLPEKPNIILILCEGCSDRIITDEREIAPNLAEFRDSSLVFSDYFNHTFATYRGIIGQLYSGYQAKNNDVNHLTGLHDILSGEGYHTTMINTEPNNAAFTAYLESMGFDEVIDHRENEAYENEVRTDKEAYELLFDRAAALHEEGEPFFECMYTYCTHVSFDSPDEVYGDGKNAFLNKFYNMDYQFGEFWEKLYDSPLKDDTIVIFTADHATYADEDYNTVFDGSDRPDAELDTVPFYIWYDGIEAGNIDAGGRNSLDLVPTILDYLDIDAPNSFLGGTLFREAGDIGNNFDTVFFDGFHMAGTLGGTVSELSEKQAEILTSELALYEKAATGK
ncbi:MAG: sulfatase-like hydrolase/transferase [Lachnospiraceae bacterium]|nr:sulfatase-like hydrolase/transferase [Lachnospiraceae bacterium]